MWGKTWKINFNAWRNGWRSTEHHRGKRQYDSVVINVVIFNICFNAWYLTHINKYITEGLFYLSVLLHLVCLAVIWFQLVKSFLVLLGWHHHWSHVLFHQEVVLDPKGEPIHDNGHHYDDQDELQGLIRLNPSDEKQRNLHNGSTKASLGQIDKSFRDDDDKVPDGKLDSPVFIAYAA